MLTLEDYKKLNKSFLKSDNNIFVYHCTWIGFTANINWIINCILYCLYHKKCLVINTKLTYYSKTDGLSDFFKKFWIELEDLPEKTLNYLEKENIIDSKGYETNSGVHSRFLCTKRWHAELWKNTRLFNYNRKVLFELFKLNTLLDIENYIYKNYFIKTELFDKDINNIYNEIKLDVPYISMHVRRGDKTNENTYANINQYTNILKNIKLTNNKPINTLIKDIFIMTDDNTIIKSYKDNLKNFNIHHNKFNTLEGFQLWRLHKFTPESHPYPDSEKKRYTIEESYMMVCCLFAELKMVENSSIFISDMRSHVSATAGMINKDKFIFDINPFTNIKKKIQSKCFHGTPYFIYKR